jgi:integral membrane protein
VIETFRKIALVEGITTLFLFFVAMPFKYLAAQPALVPPAGWAHGAAFVVYVAMMMVTLRTRRVGALGWLRTFGAALVPFGTFVNDRWLKELDSR